MRVIILTLIFFLSLSVFGQEKIVDNAGVLTAEEKAELALAASYVADKYQFDLVIVTEKSIASGAMEYADDFFDYNGYGLGPEKSGCLFLHVTEGREFWFSGAGAGDKILLSYAGEKLEGDALKFLREGRYFDAYHSFILDWEYFLSLDANGRSYNFFQRWNVALVIVAWIISLAAAGIVILVWKKSMNTVIGQTQAAAYIVAGSVSFREKKDRFLYSVVNKTVRRDTQSSGGGGLHTSSSGRTHSGRGGRY